MGWLLKEKKLTLWYTVWIILSLKEMKGGGQKIISHIYHSLYLYWHIHTEICEPVSDTFNLIIHSYDWGTPKLFSSSSKFYYIERHKTSCSDLDLFPFLYIQGVPVLIRIFTKSWMVGYPSYYQEFYFWELAPSPATLLFFSEKN